MTPPKRDMREDLAKAHDRLLYVTENTGQWNEEVVSIADAIAEIDRLRAENADLRTQRDHYQRAASEYIGDAIAEKIALALIAKEPK